MRLEIRTEGVDFIVSSAPQPKTDQDGGQKADRHTGELLFVTELVAIDGTGGEVIKVTTAGEAPKVTKKQLVQVAELVVVPWNIDGRGGVTFKAESVTLIGAGRQAATAGASS